MVSIDLKDIPDVEGLDLVKMPWKPVTDEQKAKVACILDEVCVLNIPKPQTPQEEEELVNRFLDGMRKLFSKENNWTSLPMLETSMDYCAQCNSCSDACHLYEMSGHNEMYRPNFRSEIFRRIYKQYVKKEPLAKWRYGDMGLNWKTVARLGELAAATSAAAAPRPAPSAWTTASSPARSASCSARNWASRPASCMKRAPSTR